MKVLKLIITFLLAALMLFGAFNHVYAPEIYAPFIPDFFSESFANIVSAIAEGIIGIALIVPKYRRWGGLGFCILMILFLPIHIWDFTKEIPAIGSKLAAGIRLAVQFLFIAAGWWIYKTSPKTT